MSETPAAPNDHSVTVYRLDPRPGLRLFGMRFILAAVLVIVAWLCAVLVGGAAGTIVAALVGGAAVLLIIVTVVLLVRPPAVIRLDYQGYRLGRVPQGGVRQAQWTDVAQVTTGDSEHGRALVFSLDGAESRIPLLLVAARSAELQREVHERLNRAHGYRRLE